MNSFGRIFKVEMLGESHGECVGVLIDGCPAGIPLTIEDFLGDLERRRSGAKGTTPRKESDTPIIKSGVFNGHTTGAPILILFENQNTQSKDYDRLKIVPRPGHADLVAKQKFGGWNDHRGGGHFSGRLTTGVVAAGVVAKKIITPSEIRATLVEVGGSTEIESVIDQALQEGDSLGGIVECRVSNVPASLGEPFFDSAESLLAHAVFSIPAIKGIEFGSGFQAAKMKGSQHNDNILSLDGKTETNHAGGINGGITNGNQVVFRIAVKPTSSIKKEKRSIDTTTGEQVNISVEGRHDACIALRVPPVLEAVAALVFADLMLIEQKVSRVRR